MISVILKKDVDSLGRAGDIVRVRPGYGRNYLIPRGMALLATRGNVAQHEHHRRSIEAEQARMRANQQKLADQLRATSVSIARTSIEYGGCSLVGTVNPCRSAPSRTSASWSTENVDVPIAPDQWSQLRSAATSQAGVNR